MSFSLRQQGDASGVLPRHDHDDDVHEHQTESPARSQAGHFRLADHSPEAAHILATELNGLRKLFHLPEISASMRDPSYWCDSANGRKWL